MKSILLDGFQGLKSFTLIGFKCFSLIKIDFNDLLKPVRKEDNGKDLWSVFNVVQEKIIEGDFEYIAAGKARKARQIKNFKQDQKINKDLFELALEYVK